MVSLLLGIVYTAVLGFTGLSSTFQVSFTYDDNPFLLSPADRAAFRSAINPHRYPFNTADDLDVVFNTRLSWDYSEAGRVRLRIRSHQFVSNWVKSYSVAGVGLNQRLGKIGNLEVSWTWMPNYLIRYYLNPVSADTSVYAPCRFTEHLGAVELVRRLGAVELAPFYRWEWGDYLSQFNYYDTRAHRLGGKMKWQPAGNLTVAGSYEFKIAAAAGPLPDISYRQHSAGVSALSWPQRFDRLGVQAGYEFEFREYTSRNTPDADPDHVDRVDRTEKVSLALKYRVRRILVSADYALEWRAVSSPFRPQIQDIKDYRQNRIGLGVTINSGRWRR